jgi:hypothetical protein
MQIRPKELSISVAPNEDAAERISARLTFAHPPSSVSRPGEHLAAVDFSENPVSDRGGLIVRNGEWQLELPLAQLPTFIEAVARADRAVFHFDGGNDRCELRIVLRPGARTNAGG